MHEKGFSGAEKFPPPILDKVGYMEGLVASLQPCWRPKPSIVVHQFKAKAMEIKHSV